MKPKHVNCRCRLPEQEITCTSLDSDYEGINTPEKDVEIIRLDDFERIKEYNENMKDTCPDFKPWPTNQKELDKLMHEKAIETAGGIENLNFAKALVGEIPYGKYHPRSKTIDDLLKNNPLNCSDIDRVPSNAEKIDEKTVRMKVKKD